MNPSTARERAEAVPAGSLVDWIPESALWFGWNARPPAKLKAVHRSFEEN